MTEEADRGNARRRASDNSGARKFFRFDPTVSTGTLIQIGTIMVGFAVAYGAYREDRATTTASIELVKLTTDRDRGEVKSAVLELRSDIKDVKSDLGEVKTSLAVLKAQNQSVPEKK